MNRGLVDSRQQQLWEERCGLTAPMRCCRAGHQPGPGGCEGPDGNHVSTQVGDITEPAVCCWGVAELELAKALQEELWPAASGDLPPTDSRSRKRAARWMQKRILRL